MESLTLNSNFSRHTLRSYHQHLKRFWQYTGSIDTGQINKDLVEKYSRFLGKQNLKKSSQNYHLIALRSFLQYLKRFSIPCLNPKLVKLSEISEKVVRVIDSETLRQVIEAPDTTKKDGLRDRSLLEVLFCLNLKVSSLVSLNRSDLDFSSQTLNGNPLSDSATIWLESYLKSRKDTFSPLFIRFQGQVNMKYEGESMRLTDRSIERIVKKYAQRTNLTGITPESFRRNSD